MAEESKHALTPFEVKEVDEEARTFSGYASTWDKDLGGDVIEKGAFKKTISEWRKSKRVLPLLDSHDRFSIRSVIGKLQDASEDDTGLDAEFKVIDGPDGDEAFRRVRGGYVDGLSIGYRPVKVKYPETEAEKEQGIYRYIKELKLIEVSVVQMPMNPNARIDVSTVKAMIERAELGDLDDVEVGRLRELQDKIGALLAGPGAAPEVLEKLNERIVRLSLQRAASRARDVLMHSRR